MVKKFIGWVKSRYKRYKAYNEGPKQLEMDFSNYEDPYITKVVNEGR